MILKEPIKISAQTLNDLKSVEGKMLLKQNESMLLILTKFNVKEKTETVTKKRFLRPAITKIETELYLTEAVFWCYDSEHENWGTLSEWGVDRLLTYFDLRKMRTSYKKLIRVPLEKLGFEIVKKKK